MLAHLRSKVLNEITELIIVETTGNGHCLAADTGLDQMSDVASGKTAAITTDDGLAQLGDDGLVQTRDGNRAQSSKTCPSRSQCATASDAGRMPHGHRRHR